MATGLVPLYDQFTQAVRDLFGDIQLNSSIHLSLDQDSTGTTRRPWSEDDVLDRLNARSYCYLDHKDSRDEEPEVCAICHDEYKDEEKIGVLDCGHEYHVECVKPCLLTRNTCPLCRRQAFNME